MLSEEKEKLIIQILDKIKDGQPSSVSDVLYGVDRPPGSGSGEDLLVRELEQELIVRKLVKITEPGGTNKTHNGYAYFVISVEGLQWLRTGTQGEVSTRTVLIHALSTSEDDKTLLDEGLVIVGLLGYILDRQQPDSAPLEWIRITFNQYKEDNLYTTTREKERISKRNPRDMGVVGYVYTQEKHQTVRLRRLYNKHTFDHLYITNFINFADEKTYNNESDDNPMFLHRTKVEGSSPLYLYSNVPEKFQPTPQGSDIVFSTENDTDFTKEDRIKELWEAIERKGLDKDAFSVPPLDTDSITVFVSEGPENFLINLQENRNYFTVRINPPRPDGDYIFNDVDSWKSVMTHFNEWLDLIDNNSQTPSTIISFSDAEGVRFLEGATPFRFRNERIQAVLNVETQARIFFRLLDGIPTSENGLLLGIFGKWGRGKTYFWEKLKDIFAERANNSVKHKTEKKSKKDPESLLTVFEHVEFHAWKYQDTPASWAYMYEVFVKKFYERRLRVLFTQYTIPVRRLNRLLNRLYLNLARVGWVSFAIGMLALVYGLVWYFFLDFELKWKLISWVITLVGLGPLISGLLYYYFYSGTAKKLIKQYFSEPTYQDLLGIQAEIQKELRALFGVWIRSKKIDMERIVLFVDDIDRCSEERIIQVIDSLKVMMDDTFISQRVIVIAAIDETVLKRAIKLKYYDMVTQDLSLSEEEKKETLEQLCREYMDKLFLNGFKLGLLSPDDKIDIVNSITKDRIFFRNDDRKEEKFEKEKTTSQTDTPPPAQNVGLEPRAEEGNTPIDSAIPDSSVGKAAESKDPNKFITMLPKEEFEIMDYELEYIFKAVKKFKDATPRSIRIFYYRYLLAKHFKEIIIQKNSGLYNEWLVSTQKEILCFMIVEYSSVKKQKDLLAELASASLESSSQVSTTVLGQSFTLSANLYRALLKVVEMVVPY